MNKPIKDPVINLQVYDTFSKPKPPQTTPLNPSLFTPIFTGEPYSYVGSPFVPSGIPVIKNYNLDVSGPFENHIRLSSIYEDIAPTSQCTKAPTITSRLIFRKSLIASLGVQEGDFLSLSKEKSIIGLLKFLGLSKEYGDGYNPYKGKKGLLVYKTAYPLRLNKSSMRLTPSIDSSNVNVKIYNIAEQNAETDIHFYRYIRDNVINNFVCPNFTLLHGFYRLKDHHFNFTDIDTAKGFKTTAGNGVSQVLVAVTESPSIGLRKWAEGYYETTGGLNIMKLGGYHLEKVWYSVLFQVTMIMTVLQKHGILIDDMSIDNFFIKYVEGSELEKHQEPDWRAETRIGMARGSSTLLGSDNTYRTQRQDVKTNTYKKWKGYWRYVIDGIEHFVPNVGYQVLFDINLCSFKKHSSNDIHFKRALMNDYKKLMSPNNFKNLPDNVSNLLDSIHTTNRVNIDEVFIYYLRHYINNRIGTLLRDNEIGCITNNKNVSNGRIHAEEVQGKGDSSFPLYRFVLKYKDNEILGINTTKELEQKDISVSGEIQRRRFDINTLEVRKPSRPIEGYRSDVLIVQDAIIDEQQISQESIIETYVCPIRGD